MSPSDTPAAGQPGAQAHDLQRAAGAVGTPQRRPGRMAPLAVRAFTASTAAGCGVAALAQAVAAQHAGLQPNAPSADHPQPLPAFVGRIAALDDAPLPAALGAWDCRATRLAWLALQHDDFAQAVAACVQRRGAARVGLVLGTSASTIAASEQAYRHPAEDGGFPPALRLRALHSPHAVAQFCALQLGLQGPVVTVSTACSSSARAFGQAERWLRLGLVDAVVVGGVDALCDSVLYGFHALGLVSPEPCRPFSAERRGISVGEGAGFALLERASDGAASAQGQPAALCLLGYGEASDAHHMSSPHPQGLGAELALDDALARAGLRAEAVDHVNLHGTGTPQNDAVEAALVARRYAPGVLASATKGLTGHTMGAAGIVEAVLCLLALRQGLAPGSAQVPGADPALGECFAGQLQLQPRHAPLRVAASHSFGFGGNNSVLLFGRGEATPAAGTPQAQHEVFIDGIALWTPAWPDWDRAAAALRGEPVAAADPPPRRPAPAALAANERRRAPDSVLLALEVAQAAVGASGHAAQALASVFSSAFGDLPIVDALCRTLAEDALLLSPTRFHHSVHNAASGYWGMASGSHAASTALAAFDHSFAAGLLEAAALCTADARPVLLAAYDTEASGPLASVNTCRGLLGLGLVLSPRPGPASRWRLGWQLAPMPAMADSPAPRLPASAAALALHANAQASALPLFEALAHGRACTLALPAGPGVALQLELHPA